MAGPPSARQGYPAGPEPVQANMLYSLRALLLVASVSAFKVATVPSTVPAPAAAPPTKIAVAPEKILAGNLAAQQQKHRAEHGHVAQAKPEPTRSYLSRGGPAPESRRGSEEPRPIPRDELLCEQDSS